MPTLDEAVSAYEASGGRLTTSSSFGRDPLAGHENLLRERQRSMDDHIPAPAELFSFAVNGLDTPFAQSLQFNYDRKDCSVGVTDINFFNDLHLQ